MQTQEAVLLTPKENILLAHNRTKEYANYRQFSSDLIGLLDEAKSLDAYITMVDSLGFIEPLSGEHRLRNEIQSQGSNYRETFQSNGLISRNRAILLCMEDKFGSLENIRKLKTYLPEYFTGFAVWMSHYVGTGQLAFSEYMDDVPVQSRFISPLVRSEDLCNLSYSNNSFDLIICNELFEHIYDPLKAYSEIFRVLKQGGYLMATFPMAFGQYEHIEKAHYDPESGTSKAVGLPEYHGDPVRPHEGSLVYTIPGWKILDDLRNIGFVDCSIRHTVSWQFGIFGSDLPGVLVLHAKKPLI